MVRMLPKKILGYLEEAGADGAKRLDVLQRFRCTAEELDIAIDKLVAEDMIVVFMHTTRGRPARRYYARGAVPNLTPPTEPAIPVAPGPDNGPIKTSSCRTCGRAIPVPPTGRPYVYCSRACRFGGFTMRAWLARASDPRIFAEVAICLVMADLLMRGFEVARSLFLAGPRILVTDHEGGRFVDVVPIGLEGHFPDPNDYTTMAGVYLDGRIIYAGRDNFIGPSPEIELVGGEPALLEESGEIEKPTPAEDDEDDRQDPEWVPDPNEGDK
jgi:hypothetical protein